MSALDSEKTKTARALMKNADGRSSLRESNQRLLEGAPGWELLAISGILFLRAAEILQELLEEGRDTQERAANALARAANVLDGLPKQDEMVASFQDAPANLELNDWIHVARECAFQWAQDVPQYFKVAAEIKDS